MARASGLRRLSVISVEEEEEEEEVVEEEEDEDEEEEEEEEEGNVGILKMDNGAGCSFCSWLAAVDCRCDVGIKL